MDPKVPRAQARRDALSAFGDIAGKASQQGFISQRQDTSVSNVVKTEPKTNFFGDIAYDVGSFAVNSAITAGSYAIHAVQDVFKQGKTAISTPADYFTLRREQSKLNLGFERLQQQQDEVLGLYKSGKIDKTEFIDRITQISDANQNISKRSADITERADPYGRAWAVTETAVNVLSLGSFQTAKTGTKIAGKSLVNKHLISASRRVEEAISASGVATKALNMSAANPILKKSIENIAKKEARLIAGETTAQWTRRNLTHVANSLLIKRPLVYEWSMEEDAVKIYQDIMEGDFPGALKSSAWLGTQMLNGGPLGAIGRSGKFVAKKTALYAGLQPKILDELSRQIGNGDPAQLTNFLKRAEKRLSPEEYKVLSDEIKVIVETNLLMAKERSSLAVSNILSTYVQSNADLTKLTPRRLMKDMRNWAKADIVLNNLRKSGKLQKLGVPDSIVEKLVVVRWDATMRKGLADAISAAGPSRKAIREVISELSSRPGVGWGNSQTLTDQLENLIKEAADEVAETAKKIKDGANIKPKNLNEVMAKKVRGITAASAAIDEVPKAISKELGAMGYIVAAPAGRRLTPVVEVANARKLITDAVDESDEVFQKGMPGKPIVEGIARVMSRRGVSTYSNNVLAFRRLGESVANQLDNTQAAKSLWKGTKKSARGDTIKNGQRLLYKLQNYVDGMKPTRIGKKTSFGRAQGSAVQDIRQMTITEIMEATGLKAGQEALAKEIRNSIIEGYLKVPLDYRSLGDRVVDRLYQANIGYRYYSRAQSALRYTYNPFFSVQERFETFSITHGTARTFKWGQTTAELDARVDDLVRGGVLSGIVTDSDGVKTAIRGDLSGALSGEAVQDAVLGRVTADIDIYQKRNLAGLALAMAKKRGMSLDDMMANHFDELADALKIVVQYPDEGVLSSSLARTMNLAFFPLRYNAKVAQIAGRELARLPPSVQYATIKSLFSLDDWLQSEEGVNWKSENADVLRVLGWLTPVGSVTAALNILSGKVESVSDIGILGGLPLGVITQILDSQGVISINTPYVDPKSGDLIPTYIPESEKARAATALVDLLGFTFTYPGRTLGLPGKNKALRDFTRVFIDTNGQDFEKRIEYDQLTEQQKAMIEVIKGDFSEETIDQLYQKVDAKGNVWPSLPPLELPMRPKE